jgi:hypothetical protein
MLIFSFLSIYNIGYAQSRYAEFLIINKSSSFIEPDEIYIEYENDAGGKLYKTGMDIPEYDAVTISRKSTSTGYCKITSIRILDNEGLKLIDTSATPIIARNNNEKLVARVYKNTDDIYRLDLCDSNQATVKKFIIINNSTNNSIILDTIVYNDDSRDIEITVPIEIHSNHIYVIPIQSYHFTNNLYIGKEVNWSKCSFLNLNNTPQKPLLSIREDCDSFPILGLRDRGPMAVGVEIYNLCDK